MSGNDQPNSKIQEAWAAGDYGAIGSRLVIVGELLCRSVDLRATNRVLDVATGDGNTALSAARRGCQVVGIDITVPLLEQGRRRAEAENLPVRFRDGDAEDLPFSDSTFDAVLSTFGVVFAPNQQLAADELLRVCRPGGKIGLTSWVLTGANLIEDQVIGRYFPPDPDQPPNLWSTEEGIRKLLGDGTTDIQVEPCTVAYRFPSVQSYVETAFEKFGPLKKMVETLTTQEREQLGTELVDELEGINQSGDETMVIPFDYLEVVATTRI